MKICIFEWCVGGGFAAHPKAANHLLREGKAMRDAIAFDFAQLGMDVVTLQDIRIPATPLDHISYVPIDDGTDIDRNLKQIADDVDHIMVIAPETDGCLLQIVESLDAWASKIISPPADFIAIAADKWVTRTRLEQHGVPVPPGFRVYSNGPVDQNSLPMPWIVKPVDGCGSEGIRFEPGPTVKQTQWPRPALVETYIPGIPVSMSAVINENGICFLPPVQQLFSRFPVGLFVGCQFPLPTDLQHRAKRLAQQVFAAMPKGRGYVGIDMVLADSGHCEDVVIEVNPRLTSSYLRLRRACGFSIAKIMLA